MKQLIFISLQLIWISLVSYSNNLLLQQRGWNRFTELPSIKAEYIILFVTFFHTSSQQKLLKKHKNIFISQWFFFSKVNMARTQLALS